MTKPALYVPNRYALVAGGGDAETGLNAFDRALQVAEGGQYNLVKVTSILPPAALAADHSHLPAGAIVFAAIGSETSNKPGLTISASVAVGIPKDPSLAGVIMEGHFHCSAAEAEARVRKMAEEALTDRNYEILRIESIAVDHLVEQAGSVVAAVLLWREE